jgi:hypothetical protein
VVVVVVIGLEALEQKGHSLRFSIRRLTMKSLRIDKHMDMHPRKEKKVRKMYGVRDKARRTLNLEQRGLET